MELKIRQINVFFFISAIHKLLNINFLKQNMSIALFFFLTSSLRHPKIFVKEFSDFLMSCHQHCLGVNLLVQR